jgi:hypothetical protein
VAHAVTSSCDNPPTVTRVICNVRCTTPGATVPRSAERSRSSWSSSASSKSSSCAATACLPASEKTISMCPTRVMRRWSSRMPRGRSRSSTATLTLNLATTSAASSSISCTMVPRTSCPGASSRHCAGQWQSLHLSRVRHPTTSGWR